MSESCIRWLREQRVWAPMEGEDEANPTHVPFVLDPIRISRQHFSQATMLAPLFSNLIYQLGQADGILRETVGDLGRFDPFCAVLERILLGSEQPCRRRRRQIIFNISRSDYLIDDADSGDCDGGRGLLRQVELNTIACSFVAQSARITEMHRFINTGTSTGPVVTNNCLDQIGFAFQRALQLQYTSSTAIAIVVRPGELGRNSDIRLLRECLEDRFHLQVILIPMNQLPSALHSTPDGRLYHGGVGAAAAEVGLVYWRAGYDLSDYLDSGIVDARIMIEQSRAIKCPDIRSQIVGLKKIQQRLTEASMLERFVSIPEARILRECFANIYSFDANDDPGRIAQMALDDPDGYVLKPQREGGGHNLYGAEMVAFIREHPDQLPAYILMQKIRPHPAMARLVKASRVEEVPETISELGIYGVWLSDEYGRVIINQAAGHLCRTKPANVDEGGVFAGFSCLASVVID